MDQRIAAAGRRALAGEPLERDELLEAVGRARRRPLDLLYWADRLRRRVFGRRVKLCSIVPGKLGGCAEDCKWCAQSAKAAAGLPATSKLFGWQAGLTPVRRTPVAQVRRAARTAAKLGASSIGIVNSGKKPTADDLAQVVRCVRAVRADGHIAVCTSLGRIARDQADQLARAGAARYHHNLETSRRFFPEVVSTHGYDERLAALAAARAAGMEICCGGLFGIGENWQDRIDLALTLRDRVRPDTVPLNFLVPIEGTPLGAAAPLAPTEALSIIAAFRLALPAVDLKVAGGREAVLRDLQSWIFSAGATSCMIGDYLTLAGRKPEDDLQMISDLGLTVSAELQPAPDWPRARRAADQPAVP